MAAPTLPPGTPQGYKLTCRAQKIDSKDGVTGLGGTSDP